jgi:hypothetical protein
MIDRIVLLQLTDDHADAAEVHAVAEHSLEVLGRLPGVVDVRVGTAADEATASQWHVSLLIRFSSAADLEPFRVHPDHRAYVDDFLRPRLEAITAFNFEVA